MIPMKVGCYKDSNGDYYYAKIQNSSDMVAYESMDYCVAGRSDNIKFFDTEGIEVIDPTVGEFYPKTQVEFTYYTLKRKYYKRSLYPNRNQDEWEIYEEDSIND